MLASVVTTLFQLPAAVTAPLKELSKFFIIMAMAAIGLNTNIVHLVRTGGKPILLYVCGQSLNLVLTLLMAWIMFYKVFPEITAKI